MQKRALLNTIILVLPVMFSSVSLAAESAPSARQYQQRIDAGEHANHVAPASSGEAPGTVGAEGRAGNAISWTAFPMLKTRMGGEGRDRMVTVVPQGIVANNIYAYSNFVKNGGGHRLLPLEMAGARLDKPEVGGFHWLAAREEQADKVRIASTVYFFSNPGNDPTALFMQQKHELEIVPQPYPREHSRYRANEDWNFLVRFNGKPLANRKVLMETRNGTRTELISDSRGVIAAHFPDDFRTEADPQKTAGSREQGRRSADFVLATEHTEGGKSYLTAFNSSYGPNALDQRSLAMGMGFTLLGMIGAAPLLRQRRVAQSAAVKPQTTDTSAATEAVRKEEA